MSDYVEQISRCRLKSINRYTHPYLIIAFCVLFFSGCGGGGGSLTERIFAFEPEPEAFVGWEFTLTKMLVEQSEENRTMLGIPIDDGDEPYFVVIGLKSTPGVSGSTSDRPIVNEYRDKRWAGHLRDGQQMNIPLSMGRVRFSEVYQQDIIGIVVVALEADLTPWTMIDERVEALSVSLRDIFVDAIENRPPSNGINSSFISDLHASMQTSIRLLTESTNATQSLERRVYSLSDVDDVIGFNSLIFLADQPRQEIRLPFSPGYFLTDVLDMRGIDYQFYRDALVFDTNDRDARYFVEMRIRAF